MHVLDIIVPARNEADSLPGLAKRVDEVLSASGVSYRLIIVDDHSSDSSLQVLKKLSTNYPVTYLANSGHQGKAFAILAGLEASQAPYLGMIDADLEYPPEAIPEMFKLLTNHGLVVANRRKSHTGFVRRLASKANSFIFGKLIMGFKCDVQSGLKLFSREVYTHLNKDLVGAWSIDMPLLHTTHELGLSIGTTDIQFSPRTSGKSKLKSEFFKAITQIGGGALRLKFTSDRKIILAPTDSSSNVGAGVVHKRQRYITHSRLPLHLSALETLHFWQKVFLTTVLTVLVGCFYLFPYQTGLALVGILTFVYFADVLFNLFLVLKSLHFPPELTFSAEQMNRLQNSKLPVYTILCPLYKEAHVLPQFIESISALDWPKNRLDVLLLLEADDTTTIEAAQKGNLPKYVRTLVVPHSFPKTKPKACNYGLQFARGEYVVVYDAEDRPDPNQLKMAYLGFQNSLTSVGCLQAKLNYYNPHQNLLTRLFTAEYSLWFDVVLPGLQSVNTAIPLGGTSNHFKTSVLKSLHGWDAFNVTEDCDLGARLFKAGYTTAIIDSTTLEEANSHLGNWLRQRSRWIKGYIQTYLVHNRNPFRFVRDHGVHAFIFQLVVGGKIAFMLINPLLWLATVSYFVLYSWTGAFIESLFPIWIFYLAAFSLVFGNFLFLFYYMVGAAKKGHWTVIKYVYLVPLYWLAVSVAAYKAIVQLVFKPHYWEKTHHGLHLKSPDVSKVEKVLKRQVQSSLSSNFGLMGGLAKSTVLSGGMLIIASVVSNLLNFLYNAYLGRASNVSVEQFGLISLFGSLLSLTHIPAAGLSRTITYRSAYLLGKHKAIIFKFWQYVHRKTLSLAILATGFWFLLTPTLQSVFHTPNYSPFVLFSPILVIGALTAVSFGFLNGNQKFGILALMTILEAVSKLVFTIVLVSLGLTDYVYLALPLSMAVALSLGWHAARSLPRVEAKLDDKTITHFPWKFFGTSVLLRLSTIVFLSLDIVLAKHFLSPAQAGEYALLSLVGKMVFFAGSLFSQFTGSLVSHQEGAANNSSGVFIKLLTASVLTSGLAYLVVGIFGFYTVPLLLGNKTIPILHLLPVYCLAMLCFSTTTTITSYFQIRKSFMIPFVTFVLAAMQVGGIYLYHSNLAQIVYVMSAIGIVSLPIVVLLHLLRGPIRSITRNLQEVLPLIYFPSQVSAPGPAKLRILIFNWRDLRHKWGGGAEVYVQELAQRLVTRGCEVAIFCGNDGHCLQNEIINGVRIFRRGGFYTVYIWAFLYYMFYFRGKYDLVIDSENGAPFFTPVYVGVPIIAIVYHINQEIFRVHLPFLLGKLASFVEGKLLPLIYQNIKMVTISDSSKEGLGQMGLGKRKTIEIIHPGVNISKFKPGKKSSRPSVLYLGRLKPYKSVETVIYAVEKLVRTIPNLTFTIAGDGESRPQLESLVRKLGLESAVKFAGKIRESDKPRLYARSWVAVQPSSMEGWGITTIEANASGTAVVAANVPGLRDSVQHTHTGMLVPWGDVNAFAKKIERLLISEVSRKYLEIEGLAWAKQFTWDKSANALLEIIEQEIRNKSVRRVIKFEAAYD